MEIPLFPLRSVLCPGVALPLHIFEQRYRLMVRRCLARDEPFGVVLLREGTEVGPLRGQVADIGTTAVIRRAGSYADGGLDILTVGQQRFRLDGVDHDSEPYLMGRVKLLDEPTGPEPVVRDRAVRVGRRFLEYLELLQPEGVADGPEIEIEFEIEVDAGEGDPEPGMPEPTSAAADAVAHELEAADLSRGERRELLMAAAHRLVGTDDPTALSYVLTALIQVDLSARQELLEAPDTTRRLERLEALLGRESWFLKQGLRPIIIEARQAAGHVG
jgi:Lon protease-like protein